MFTKQSYDLVLCIGNGDLRCDRLTRELASQYNMPYHLILDHHSVCLPGFYHTSIYDIKLAQLKQKLKDKKVKIFVLDLEESDYQTAQDYYETMSMVNALSDSVTVEYQNEKHNSWINQQLRKNKAFCIMPFVGIYQTSNGGSHCCLMPAVWNSQDSGFYAQKSQHIREKILNGERVPECNYCYNLDDNNAPSERTLWSSTWSKSLNIQTHKDLENNIVPKIYNLGLGNECNLLCRTCYPRHSNLIEKEYRRLGFGEFEIFSTKTSIFDAIPLESIEKLMVGGGEPTVNKDFLEFLENMPTQLKQQLDIIISTNAAVLSEKLQKLVKQFSNLKFGISIDGFDQVNHYIRWPTQWTKLVDNIEFLYTNGKISHFNTTVSIYNIDNLFDLYQWIDAHYPDVPCFVNFADDPEQVSPWNHPNRAMVFDNLEKIKKLKLYQTNQVIVDNIEYIEKTLNNWHFDQLKLDRFFHFNDCLDKSRGILLGDYIKTLEWYRNR
jgi:MoaA/NifB/PqqE/SkfB family radical SAM enzyme